MQSLTFESHKILKSAIRDSNDRTLRYNTSTTKQGFSRHRTTLEDASASRSTGPTTIDWRERTFEIADKTHSIDLLKRKLSNFSEKRYWKWCDGDEYKVKFATSSNNWSELTFNLIQVTNLAGDVIAELDPYIEHTFKPSSPVIIRLARDIRDDEERRFLMLVLLYSETKRLDRQD
ncbi:hypothetical protein C8R43DRAFT_1173402 [Mycena crocata]|nr:hypothetical protein C8R43DRAFT_1173402 [Mycena crocata]